jgi:type II secretory pathway pseudopilin PulG
VKGFGLIDLMVAVAILGIAVAMFVASSAQHQRAAERASAAEGLVRLLDQELERARACPTRSCLERLATETTTVSLDPSSRSWVRARVKRVLTNGPSGTARIEIGGSVPGLLRERRVAALIWVRE